MDQKKKSFAIAALRRASYRWPGRYLASKESHIGRNQYRCNICKGIYAKKDTHMDHRFPIVNPLKGWENFDTYIDRLFVEKELFQRLCLSCHGLKTSIEGKVRRKTRARKAKKLIE
jgi:hypothetical protein